MKEPTTPHSVEIQENAQITRDFLESEGWVLNEEKPLFEAFEHSQNAILGCSIGLYGGFSIYELHWCNGTPERQFSTVNPNLTKEDYYEIVRLLNLKLT